MIVEKRVKNIFSRARSQRDYPIVLLGSVVYGLSMSKSKLN